MKLKLVSFETAKLLKEVGFDIKVTSHYRYGSDYKEVELLHNSSLYNMNCKDEQLLWSCELYSAPTLALTQMWLREKHSIIVTVELDRTSLPKYQYNVCRFTEDNGFKNEINPDLHRTYDEALEIGILKGVKLIKEK